MLYWKKMPSLWIGNRITEFNSIDTSTAIAAMKIYMTLCFFNKKRDDGIYVVNLTFTQIGNIASISRSLVNEGLKLLIEKELVKNLSLTKRKKLYTLDTDGATDDGWCKLPMAGVVSEDGSIPAYQSMHNRYHFEFVALQLYLYLLYARDNNHNYTLARKQTICNKLECRVYDLNKAISYLIHIGLLQEAKQKALANSTGGIFHDSFYFYFKTKSKDALTYKKPEPPEPPKPYHPPLSIIKW